MSKKSKGPKTPKPLEGDKPPEISRNVRNSPPPSLGDYSLEELEEGLNEIGFGQYNLKYTLVIALMLVASMIEVIGNAVVLPAAQCDLDISDVMKGAIAAIPFIGIVLTSYIHGYMIDTRGRKKMAVCTSLAAGSFAFLTAFMPNLTSFVIFKCLTSLWLATPSALPYTFVGEIVPHTHRARLLTVVNAIQIIGSAIDPLLAWLILPLDFKINFGWYMFRPWRLLIIIYSLFFLLTACLLSCAPESPKFLLSRGKPEAALKILQTMYAANTKKSPEEFPIKTLHALPLESLNIVQCLKRQTSPLLQRKYIAYIILIGFLLFGVFVILNGIYMWVIDAMDRVLTYEYSGMSACQIIMLSNKLDQEDHVCEDTINTTAMKINSIAQVACAIIGILISLIIDNTNKFKVLCGSFVIIGVVCLFMNYNSVTGFVILMSLFPIIALAIAPLHLYCLEIYPVHIRGMAVLLCMMLGRMGSIVGTTVTGVMIDVYCSHMFFLCSVLLIACAALCFLLPGAPLISKSFVRRILKGSTKARSIK